MIKRSLTIAGHPTSIALEAEFWDGLEALARSRTVSLPVLISQIEQARPGGNLSSALRVAVLQWYRERAEPERVARATG